MKLSVVVPCYNEVDNIRHIVKKFSDAFGEENDVEIVLVNNGSVDNSQHVMEQEVSNCEKNIFKIVHVKKNIGYGNGILQGLESATGDILAWTHADLQTDPADVLVGYRIYKEESKKRNIVVKGSRRKRRLAEAFFTFGMQIISFILLRTYISDINAQPKIFSKKFYLEEIKNRAPLDFSLDLFLLYRAKIVCEKIVTFPVFFNKRLYGEAKGGGSFKTRIVLIKRTLSYILKLRKKITKPFRSYD